MSKLDAKTVLKSSEHILEAAEFGDVDIVVASEAFYDAFAAFFHTRHFDLEFAQAFAIFGEAAIFFAQFFFNGAGGHHEFVLVLRLCVAFLFYGGLCFVKDFEFT